jgi:hypothetical protein
MINTTFIQESVSDVCRKLQKMEGFAGATTDQLISIAAKVVANREEMAKREKEKYLEKKAKILAMVLNEEVGRLEARKEAPTGENGEILWEKNQCTYCKEEGHWKNEFPNKKKKEKERVTVAAAKSKDLWQPRGKHSLGRQV